MKKEVSLSLQISQYLSMQYPNIVYYFDTGSGGVQSIGMAMRNKRLNKWKSIPDLFICQPNDEHHGLFLELKAVNIYKKDGSLLKNEHIESQDEMLQSLRLRGYYAQFAVGFDQAKKLIDNYLKKRSYINELNAC